MTRSVKVLREPVSSAITKDGRYLYVTNFLPAQRADADHVAACISVIDLKTFTKVKDIRLANGSNAVHSICSSPDVQRPMYIRVRNISMTRQIVSKAGRAATDAIRETVVLTV